MNTLILRFHAVANVIHNFDADGIEIHPGPAMETAAEALVWLSDRKPPDLGPSQV